MDPDSGSLIRTQRVQKDPEPCFEICLHRILQWDFLYSPGFLEVFFATSVIFYSVQEALSGSGGSGEDRRCTPFYGRGAKLPNGILEGSQSMECKNRLFFYKRKKIFLSNFFFLYNNHYTYC